MTSRQALASLIRCLNVPTFFLFLFAWICSAIGRDVTCARFDQLSAVFRSMALKTNLSDQFWECVTCAGLFIGFCRVAYFQSRTQTASVMNEWLGVQQSARVVLVEEKKTNKCFEWKSVLSVCVCVGLYVCLPASLVRVSVCVCVQAVDW